MQVLNAVDVGSVARFLPVIFNQLFHILVFTTNEDVSLNVVRYVTRTMAVSAKTKYLFDILRPRLPRRSHP